MSSSTSNSDSSVAVSPIQPPLPKRRTWSRIALLVLGLFFLLEFVTRWMLLPASRDYVRFASYRNRAEQLVRAQGLRIAFLGNSATEVGVNPALFTTQLQELHQARGIPRAVQADFFLADGSEINTWYYMMKDTFWRSKQNPDWLIVTFFQGTLEDGLRPEVGRLALAFTQQEDWSDLFALDLPTLPQRMEYLLANVWATYAARDRIRKRTFASLIPRYQEWAEVIHDVQAQPGPHAQQLQTQSSSPSETNSTKPTPTPTWRALERFLATAQQHQNRIVFVAFPFPKTTYNLNPEIIEHIQAAGMHLLDLRQVPGLSAEHYRDSIHLTPEGADIYTRYFTQRLASLLTEPR